MININAKQLLLLTPVLLLLTVTTTFSQRTDSTENRISLLFVGDVMGHDTQIASALDAKTGRYNYEDVFRYIKPVLSEADVTIANLEVTLAGPPYKGYPQFSSPVELAVACINAGIDYFVLANNHVADRGEKGILRTLHKLDSLGIPRTGSYRNMEERDTLSPLMIYKNGFALAVLNYTYGTNGLPVPAPLVVDHLDKNLIALDIDKAKGKKADAIILCLHWGTEYDTVPGPAETELAAFCLEKGADLVIGSHPHVIQKMTWMKDPEKKGVVVYSQGNFVSNQRKPKTDGGSLVRIEMVKKDSVVSIADAGYLLTWVHTPLENNKKRFYVLPCREFEKNPGFFSNPDDFAMMSRFINESRALLNSQNINVPEYFFNEDNLANQVKNE